MRIDEGGGSASPTPESQIEDIAAGVRDFAGAAGSGFFVSDRAGQPMVDAVATFRENLISIQRNMARAKQAPRLGTTPGAERVAPHVQRSAESVDFVVRGMKGILDDLEAGLKKAMKNYQTSDAGSAQGVMGAYDA